MEEGSEMPGGMSLSASLGRNLSKASASAGEKVFAAAAEVHRFQFQPQKLLFVYRSPGRHVLGMVSRLPCPCRLRVLPAQEEMSIDRVKQAARNTSCYVKPSSPREAFTIDRKPSASAATC